MLSNSLFSLNDESYYFAIYCSNQNSWYISPKPFLLSAKGNSILGQYISSLWFKMKIDLNNTLRLAIIKHPNAELLHNHKQRYINILNITDDPISLDFVSIYSELNREDLIDMFINLEPGTSTNKEITEKMSLSFCKSKQKNNISLYCPSFYL
jgi:hypothetical protein